MIRISSMMRKQLRQTWLYNCRSSRESELVNEEQEDDEDDYDSDDDDDSFDDYDEHVR